MGPISVRLWEFSAERVGLESCVRSSLKALQAADRLRKCSSSSEQPHLGTGACVKGNFPGMKEGMNTTRIPSKQVGISKRHRPWLGVLVVSGCNML